MSNDDAIFGKSSMKKKASYGTNGNPNSRSILSSNSSKSNAMANIRGISASDEYESESDFFLGGNSEHSEMIAI